MLGGDDSLIKKLIFIVAVTLCMAAAFGIMGGDIQLLPGYMHLHDQKVCTYQYKPLKSWSLVRFNWPELPADCHYVR